MKNYYRSPNFGVQPTVNQFNINAELIQVSGGKRSLKYWKLNINKFKNCLLNTALLETSSESA